ncbi:MAG: hypothetical protein JXR96_10625 [Deltaproteobacteria bacterium]|nr:hypothetical protein [Deltaproteobacteria bacterium]
MLQRIRAFAQPDLAHVIRIQDQLRAMLDFEQPNAKEVDGFLSSLSHPSRLAAVRSLRPMHLRRLYDVVEGYRPVDVDDLVPPDVGVREQVRHYGRNSLPAFTIFEKRFMRPADDASELWGYNFQSLAPLTGPGYFVAYDSPERGEVDIDYTRLPAERPVGWPELQENERGLSRLVYAHMVDRLRGVTEHVSIGRAWKKGREQSAWFILCRE